MMTDEYLIVTLKNGERATYALATVATVDLVTGQTLWADDEADDPPDERVRVCFCCGMVAERQCPCVPTGWGMGTAHEGKARPVCAHWPDCCELYGVQLEEIGESTIAPQANVDDVTTAVSVLCDEDGRLRESGPERGYNRPSTRTDAPAKPRGRGGDHGGAGRPTGSINHCGRCGAPNRQRSLNRYPADGRCIDCRDLDSLDEPDDTLANLSRDQIEDGLNDLHAEKDRRGRKRRPFFRRGD